ncbi:putative bifunctional diguanylate cyclase/phosphodiesterase [Microvirga sp. GCM10011540]|uniref:putative bifunctional diguanylate cyclase/phosphodiesterase n=1 Tax=Microvirga sp. GCM10011540 TaxID=3317338 RepID=UPI003617CF38
MPSQVSFAMDADGSDGASALQQRWYSMQTSPGVLPTYEDTVLGGLGRHADSSALVTTNGHAPLAILWGGARFERWLGHEVQGLDIGSLLADVTHGMREVVHDALRSCAPATTHCIRFRQGTIESTGLLALPLANRQGHPFVLLFIEGVTSRLDLVDAIFRATNQGMLALSVVRGESNEVTDFTILALNEGAARLLQRPASELCLQPLSTVVPNFAATDGMTRLVQILGEGGRDSFEFTYPTKSGKQIDFKIEVGCIGDLLAVTLADITDLKGREASFRLLFEGNPIPMWLFKPEDLRILRVNDAAVMHYGYSRRRFEGMTLLDLQPSDEWDIVQRTVREISSLNGSNGHWRHLKADGNFIEVNTFARTITFEGRPAVLMAAIDVTERRRAEARIAHMAHHDALTDLPNRVLFRERLETALGHVRGNDGRLGLFCLDLDNLKVVNDTLGHSAGDELLRQAAERLRKCVRHSDLVARLGGDEFAILHTNPREAGDIAALAERVTGAFEEPFRIQGQQVLSGMSVGIATAPADGVEADLLLRNADLALYRAKTEGRRRFCFFEVDMNLRLQARQEIEHDLRQAFAERKLELHFQPIIELTEHRIEACEALLRWRHPVHGDVSPAKFIPLAEDIGLIGRIGEWVLLKACAEAVGWPEQVRVAVNLSPAQFNSGNLVACVRNALAQSGLAADRLELEVTESVLLLDNEATMSALHQLRDLGVRVAMDDFGTGYSSLSYLRAFPFDKIKIDRSFVRELGENKHCTAIIHAVTGLGRSLGIATVAEGVETRAQLEHLKDNGCDQVQGYLVSRAIPAAELRQFFETWRTGLGSIQASVDAGSAHELLRPYPVRNWLTVSKSPGRDWRIAPKTSVAGAAVLQSTRSANAAGSDKA